MYDGDIGLTSNNQILIDAIGENLNPIMYEKHKQKEQKLNPNSFANMDCRAFWQKIGQVTNTASTLTSMLSNFTPTSKEFKELQKRIDILRFYQGSTITRYLWSFTEM